MDAAQQMPPAAPVVGNAFVHQYYHILHQSPELVYRFYQETSKLGRPEADGSLCFVTTLQAINEKILSLEYSKYKAEIKTVDAQESFGGGVLVLVTGYITSVEPVKKNFSQSFFLAPQDKGFFVLNDIFRYMEEDNPQPNDSQVPQPEHDAPPPLEQQSSEQNVSPVEETKEEKVEEFYNPPENDDGSVVDEEVPVEEVIDQVPNNSHVVAESSPNIIQEETPKKSYASIVKVMKENAAPLSGPMVSVVKQVPVKSERQVNTAQSPSAPEVVAPISSTTDRSTGQEEAADGYSIYIKNLPMNCTNAQIEEAFKSFGPIKGNGIQVRSKSLQGFCFGFVEFEVASAVQSAIEASPIMIGGRQAYVEEKRPGSQVSSRGRFAPGRGGGFRGEGMRGQGNYYSGGRGYGRGDYSRGDYSNRGSARGGYVSRGDAGYQRVDNGGRVPFSQSNKNVPDRVTTA